MKLLILDTENCALSWAWRAAEAGHQVRWFVKPEALDVKEVGRGFRGIERVDNFVPSLKWADLIIVSGNDKYIERLTALKKQGYPVFGPTTESAKLEISRKAGMELLEKVGIEVVPYETFKSMEDAYKQVEQSGERFVFKTMGDNEDKSLTYVSKSAADMLTWMDGKIKQKQQPKGEVMLQEFVKGIEMGVSRFMGSKGFIGPWNESFEYKKMMPGNYGPNTGEMGTIAYFTPDSKLGDDTLGKLEEELVGMGHTGDIALGFMIPEDGIPRPTEFTARWGWPIGNMMLAAIEGDPVVWMKDALDGKDTTSFKQDIGCCLVLAHGDFPRAELPLEQVQDLPIYGITRGNKKYLHPQSVKIDVMPDMDGDKVTRRPVWNTTERYALVVTGFGKDVKQASERAYKTMGQLNLANSIVRDDVGEDLKEKLPQLHKMGYALHCSYSGE
jgi:phosphoribosylamine--glycine ligase